jgi:hypothetical protein
MKQALISLIRTVVGACPETVVLQQAVLPELTSAELRKVAGGVTDPAGPRGNW